MMVSLNSARQWYPREEFVACNADHSQIAKLKRGENSIYPSVRWAIKKALLSAGDLYSEAKETRYSESRNLEGADEAPGIRRSLLQVAHRQVPMPSHNHMADPALTPSRSLSNNTIDQRIRHVHGAKVDQSAHCDDIQSKSNTLNETVSQWRSGIKIGELDDTQSSANPKESAEADVSSVLFDKDDVASKSTELTASLGAEVTVPREGSEETNPDPTGNEVDQNTALQADNLSNLTKNTKSMTMDKVMESAITAGDEAKTRELLAHFYDVNCIGEDGITPLLLAARYRHENIVRLLLGQGANPRARCDKGRTTLHWLDSVLEEPVSETLIDLLLGDRPPFEVPDGRGVTPLMVACRIGELLLATRLIRHGADLRATNSEGNTALHYAAVFGKAHMISLLIHYGAEIEAKNSQGRTPLHDAICNPFDSFDTVDQLLQAGANKEATTKDQWVRPLHLAILNHNEACVSCLLQSGANIESVSGYGWRPLHIAAQHDQLKIVEVLLDHGANIEATTDLRLAALHIAAENSQLKIVKALLEYDVNIATTATDLRWTALNVAVKYGQIEIVKGLLDHGANIEAMDYKGLRPLHHAASTGYLEIVKGLLDRGANIEAKTNERLTALHVAAKNGQLEIVKALLEHGANPTAKTSKLVGSRPSNLRMIDSVPSAQERAVRTLLKEAEKTWKVSNRK